MKKILMYAESVDPRAVASVLTDATVETAGSKQDLVESLVGRIDLFCLMVQIERIDDAWQRLLESVRKSFPVLQTAVIISTDDSRVPTGYKHFSGQLARDELLGEIQAYISGLVPKNMRKHHRYDWPLQGHLSLSGESWEIHRVRSISAGGAYLEAEATPPKGTLARIRIEFQDCEMLTNCEILDPRHSSSILPPGFAVRFVDLSQDSSRLLDDIVNDALIHALLEPDTETPIPSIGGEELLPDAFSIL